MLDIDKLAWLCIQNNQVLCVRTKGNDTFYIPGGKREIFEDDHEALCREINEEVSVKLIKNTIKYAGTFKAQAHNKALGTYVKMTCYFADYIGQISPRNEIEEVIWLNYGDSVKCSIITKMIIEWLNSQGLVNSNSNSSKLQLK